METQNIDNIFANTARSLKGIINGKQCLIEDASTIMYAAEYLSTEANQSKIAEHGISIVDLGIHVRVLELLFEGTIDSNLVNTYAFFERRYSEGQSLNSIY